MRHIPGVITPEIERAELEQRAHEIKMEHLRATSQHPAMVAWRQREQARRAQEAQAATDREFGSLINFNAQGTLF